MYEYDAVRCECCWRPHRLQIFTCRLARCAWPVDVGLQIALLLSSHCLVKTVFWKLCITGTSVIQIKSHRHIREIILSSGPEKKILQGALRVRAPPNCRPAASWAASSGSLPRACAATVAAAWPAPSACWLTRCAAWSTFCTCRRWPRWSCRSSCFRPGTVAGCAASVFCRWHSASPGHHHHVDPTACGCRSHRSSSGASELGDTHQCTPALWWGWCWCSGHPRYIWWTSAPGSQSGSDLWSESKNLN